ncbi:DUF7002 family protein [Roseococcus suduntuyensis]|uniref:Uncharacterized protein n=1 Tax=Roseococcus suduntuyensis TaxID=455361 RepID=A0A840AI41_9PROT|nr:hypothetical protein [Roseococcus suduntuyensis]MBB3900150.1 hypothetical protein [Roseococcus suduntuyensis]
MTAVELVTRHPRLYHLTTPGAWEVIRTHGLLSTEALLRAAGLDEAEVQARIRQRRPAREVLDPTPIGRVVLNDNKPIQLAKLSRCLEDGLTPEDWLAELNRRVFFWVDAARMKGLGEAAINRTDPRELLVLDTASVVADCGARMQVSPINTGATLHQPARRGRTTFTPLGAMSYAEWRLQRRDRKASPDNIVEVTVLGAVPNVERHLIERRGF